MNDKSFIPQSFKWQELMSEYKISENCPQHKGQSDFKNCARLSYAPEDNELNMLPNFEYYKKKSKPRKIRVNDLADLHNVCLNCSLSFYTTLPLCIAFLSSISQRTIEMMEYTHIAVGNLNKSDGYVSEVENDGHFMLWEFEGVELKSRFTISQTITES